MGILPELNTMNESVNNSLKPLLAMDGKAAFNEAWQAEALALADTLVRNGVFSASTWSAALGETLTTAELSKAEDTQETYYRCVLSALEQLITTHTNINSIDIKDKHQSWVDAYLSTPHGQPIKAP